MRRAHREMASCTAPSNDAVHDAENDAVHECRLFARHAELNQLAALTPGPILIQQGDA